MAQNTPQTNPALDQAFLEMRWRCLSLAADLDRVDRSSDSKTAASDIRMEKLRRAIQVLLEKRADRAERVQMIFSDTTGIQR